MVWLYRSDLIHDTIMLMQDYFEYNKQQAHDDISVLKDITYILYGI